MVTQFNLTDLFVVPEISTRKERQGDSHARAQLGMRGRAGTAGKQNSLSWDRSSEMLGLFISVRI